MKILFSELPKYPWWGTGTPVYKNNLAMQLGVIPDQKLVKKEYAGCLKALQKNTDLLVKPFPPELDTNSLNKHDSIFVRDSFISNQKGDIVMSNFTETERAPEAAAMKHFLSQEKYTIHELPEGACAEGGEFYYAKKDDILFAGVSRNNYYGITETARLLHIKKILIVESDHFHLDTVFTIMLNKKGKLAGIIACFALIENADELKNFAKNNHLALLDIHPDDAIGNDGKGNISVNCLSVPGILIGGHTFITPGVEEKISQLGIEHIVSPITQFLYAGGGFHCLTNEL